MHSLTSSTVLGSAGALGHICHQRRGAPQALPFHWPFTEQQRGEGQREIDTLTELYLQFLYLAIAFFFDILSLLYT